jgi:hypothetical protein
MKSIDNGDEPPVRWSQLAMQCCCPHKALPRASRQRCCCCIAGAPVHPVALCIHDLIALRCSKEVCRAVHACKCPRPATRRECQKPRSRTPHAFPFLQSYQHDTSNLCPDTLTWRGTISAGLMPSPRSGTWTRQCRRLLKPRAPVSTKQRYCNSMHPDGSETHSDTTWNNCAHHAALWQKQQSEEATCTSSY